MAVAIILVSFTLKCDCAGRFFPDFCRRELECLPTGIDGRLAQVWGLVGLYWGHGYFGFVQEKNKLSLWDQVIVDLMCGKLNPMQGNV